MITDAFMVEARLLKSYRAILKCNVENSCSMASRCCGRVEQKSASGVWRCNGVCSVCAQPFSFLSAPLKHTEAYVSIAFCRFSTTMLMCIAPSQSSAATEAHFAIVLCMNPTTILPS